MQCKKEQTLKERKILASGADSCPHCSQCRDFFSSVRKINQEMKGALQKLYCLSRYNKCARYFIIERIDNSTVPDDLYPNQEIRAHSIVQEEQKRYS